MIYITIELQQWCHWCNAHVDIFVTNI